MVFTGAAEAQQATPAPKKSPFAGFGGTALDRRPGAPSMPSPFTKPIPTPSPRAAVTPQPGAPPQSSGIVLSSRPAGILDQASGGQTAKINDLQVLLTPYGVAELDTGPHGNSFAYDGPPMDPSKGAHCRIPYLMPLDQAEAILLRGRGLVSETRAVAPGFPDGLFINAYDVRVSIYNRLYILTDGAQPVKQVVSVLLKAEGVHWYPPSPPFRKIERDWHTFDYMNARNRGNPRNVIDTRVNDLRQAGKFIIVNTTGGYRGPYIPPPGELVKSPPDSPKEASVWYVPEPMINLILYSISQQMKMRR